MSDWKEGLTFFSWWSELGVGIGLMKTVTMRLYYGNDYPLTNREIIFFGGKWRCHRQETKAGPDEEASRFMFPQLVLIHLPPKTTFFKIKFQLIKLNYHIMSY